MVAHHRRPHAKPAAETPADFTGVTLTNDGPGRGLGLRDRQRRPDARSDRHARRARHRSEPRGATAVRPSSKSDGPAVVALADLSKPPRAPVLSDMLERNYPDEARKRGVPGKAVMRLRVMPDGHLRDLIVVAESQGGFGEACKRTLRDSLWSPPLDLEARPVSTFVSLHLHLRGPLA